MAQLAAITSLTRSLPSFSVWQRWQHLYHQYRFLPGSINNSGWQQHGAPSAGVTADISYDRVSTHASIGNSILMAISAYLVYDVCRNIWRDVSSGILTAQHGSITTYQRSAFTRVARAIIMATAAKTAATTSFWQLVVCIDIVAYA